MACFPRESEDGQLREIATRQAQGAVAGRAPSGTGRGDAGAARGGEFTDSDGRQNHHPRFLPNLGTPLRQMKPERESPLESEIGDFAEILRPADATEPPVIVG